MIPYAGGEAAGVFSEGSWETSAQQFTDESTCSGEGDVGVAVQMLRTDGYAVGGVNDCGGCAALWATVDGRWKEIAGTQDSWDCAILRRYRVPSDLSGTTCYDYDAQNEHAYQQD